MIRGLLVGSVFFLMGAASPSLQAADRVPAEYFVPKHILANTQPSVQCPPGHTRLFGRNPPTCFENCPPGWTVKTNVNTGAVCVRCPQGYVPAYGTGSGEWCIRPGQIVPEKEKPAPGGLWGQPWPK